MNVLVLKCDQLRCDARMQEQFHFCAACHGNP